MASTRTGSSPRLAHYLRMVAPTLALIVLPVGCQELVHMGQLSDREAAFSIGGAGIEQQQADGSWRLLGKTDANGRWWIVKEDIRNGGRIRISKPGYYPLYMRESEFLQQYNLLMIPTGGMGLGEDTRHLWGDDLSDEQGRHRN